MPQVGHLVDVDVERRLVELDDVHAVGLQRQRLLVQQLGERDGELHAVAVVAVGHGVDDGHRPGQRELDRVLRVGAQEARLGLVHAALQPQRRHHLRHHRLVAVGADAHLDLVLEVDARRRCSRKPCTKCWRDMLAVADHRRGRRLPAP